MNKNNDSLKVIHNIQKYYNNYEVQQKNVPTVHKKF